MILNRLIVSFLILFACGANVDAQKDTVSAPVRIWGSAIDFGGTVVEQAYSAQSFIAEILGASLSASLSVSDQLAGVIDKLEKLHSNQPDIILIHITQQTDASSLPKFDDEDSLTSSSSNKALSYLHLPNAIDTAGGHSHVFEALRPIMRVASVSVLGPCSDEIMQTTPATPEALKTILDADASSGQPRVAVVCSSGDASDKASLQSLSEIVASLSEKYLIVQTVAYPAAATSTSRRRLFQSSNSSSTNQTCDSTCQKHVQMLEGFIIFVLLGTALLIGLFCMHCIDTPTKFPAGAKDSRHQD